MVSEPIRPKEGERYVVEAPCPATVLTSWLAPFTGGDKKVLPPGLCFVVDFDPPSSATAVGATPEPYAEWEPKLVEAKDLNHEKYAGYHLVIAFEDVERFCRRLP